MTYKGRLHPGWCVLLFSVLILSACSQQKEAPLADKITLQLKWVHQAQFAGFYMAREKGYFAEENIEVNFIPGGLNVNNSASLLSGEADFSVVSPELVLLKRQTERAPITTIGAIYRRSAVVYVAMAESGIRHPADFVGKTAAVISRAESSGEFEYQFNAMLKRQGIDVSQVNMVPYDPSYAGFYSGHTDITAAYYTSGVIHIRNKGHKINLIWPTDYGIHFYSDIIITTEQMIERKPELVERFLRASLKGWRQAVADQKTAVDVTMKYAKIKDRQLQKSMMASLIPLVHTGKEPIGWMRDEIWKQTHRVMVEEKILERPLEDIRGAYTMRFLKAVYGQKK